MLTCPCHLLRTAVLAGTTAGAVPEAPLDADGRGAGRAVRPLPDPGMADIQSRMRPSRWAERDVTAAALRKRLQRALGNARQLWKRSQRFALR